MLIAFLLFLVISLTLGMFWIRVPQLTPEQQKRARYSEAVGIFIEACEHKDQKQAYLCLMNLMPYPPSWTKDQESLYTDLFHDESYRSAARNWESLMPSYDELIEKLRFYGKYRKEAEAKNTLFAIQSAYPHMAARATVVFSAYFNPNHR